MHFALIGTHATVLCPANGAPGLISDTVDLKRHDLAAIEKARAVVILVPKSAASISNAVATTVRFVYGHFRHSF